MRTLVAVAFFLLSVPASAFVFSYGSTGTATGDHKIAAEALIHAFRADYPQAKVEVRAATSYLKTITETLMQAFGAEAPDVGVAGLVEWPVLYKKNLLAPLSTVLTAKDVAQIRAALRPELLAQRYGVAVRDKEYVLPFNRSMPVLYVNLTALPGFENTTPTWVEFASALVKQPGAQLTLPTEDWIAEQVLLNARGAPTLQGKHAHFAEQSVIDVLSLLKRLHDQHLLTLVPSQHQAYQDFVDGKSAAALISLSTYQSVVAHATSPFKIVLPPRATTTAAVLGGGDLILPAKPGKVMPEKTKKDLRDFLRWFYLGKGTALWSSLTGYFPLTKEGAKHPIFKSALAKRPGDARMLGNGEKWTLHSLYDLDEFCRITKLRAAVSDIFTKALSSTDVALVLKQGEAFTDALIENEPCL